MASRPAAGDSNLDRRVKLALDQGWRILAEGRCVGAREMVAVVPAEHPDYWEAMTVVSASYRREHEWDKARSAITTAIEADSCQSLAMRELAWLCLQQGAVGEALEAALIACDLAEDRHGELLARAFDVLGVCQSRLGDHRGAVVSGERAVTLLPTSADLHLHLARSLAAAGDTEASERLRDVADELRSGGR